MAIPSDADAGEETAPEERKPDEEPAPKKKQKVAEPSEKAAEKDVGHFWHIPVFSKTLVGHLS